MLEYDPNKRIKPFEALQHPFFAEHLDCSKFPTLTLSVEDPINEDAMITEDAPKGVLQLFINEPFDNPVTQELRPDMGRLCRQIASKRSLFCSSTKETTRMTMIRKIFSIPCDVPEGTGKPGPDSTKPGSKEDLHVHCTSRYFYNAHKNL